MVPDDRHLSLLLESAGGRSPGVSRPRNDQYVPALRLLLGRLRELNAVILSAVVASSRVAGLPESDRVLLPELVDLADVADVEELRLQITRAQGRVGLPENAAKEGNNRKRIQLRLAVPGYGPADVDRLAADLADPVAPAATSARVLTGDSLMAELARLTLHRTPDGRISLHKPLTLLWMIDHVAAGGTRLVTWPEFRREVGAFLGEFAPGGSRVTPQYPFWHLSTARSLWEVYGVADVPTAADMTAAAGFTRQATVLLRDDSFRATMIGFLMDRYLSDAVNRQALNRRLTVGIPSRRALHARDVLRPLVGEEIRTVTGRPNMILGMDADTAIVRTDRSPTGQPIPISEVQHGLDLLSRQGTVRVNVDELGHRSAFVGAVLATLPDARVSTSPAAITLGELSSDDVGDLPATDAEALVKVRREQARLRELLADGRTIASCAICGHDYPIVLLVAAHIKKRARCTDEERHDLHNVAMLACTFGCDKLYEDGWITVDTTGHVRTAALDGLPDVVRGRVAALSGRDCPAYHAKSEAYFEWHRTNIFRLT